MSVKDMKRYWLFAGDNYYPDGGWNDFVGTFDAVQDAMKHEKITDKNVGSGRWFHIVDSHLYFDKCASGNMT